MGLTSRSSQVFREEGVIEVNVRRKFIIADSSLILDLCFLPKNKHSRVTIQSNIIIHKFNHLSHEYAMILIYIFTLFMVQLRIAIYT